MKKTNTPLKTVQSRKAVPTAKAPATAKAAKASTTPPAPVEKQPQSMEKAATQAGVYLHTDDRWSQAYFDSNDLHCAERELFG